VLGFVFSAFEILDQSSEAATSGCAWRTLF
jgi:hypothetical protein